MDSKLVYSSPFIVHSKTKTVNREPITVNQNGLALIELLIAFSIIGLVSILIAAVYFAHSRLFSTQNTLVDVSSQNKLALDEMTNQIRESQEVVSTCALCAGDTTSNSLVVLQIWPIDSSGEPFEPTGSDYDFIVYKRDTDNTKLIKKIIPGAGSQRKASQKIIATNISDLQFTYDNPDPTLASEVTINLTTSAISGGKTITSSQTTMAVLRNK